MKKTGKIDSSEKKIISDVERAVKERKLGNGIEKDWVVGGLWEGLTEEEEEEVFELRVEC